jgi:opacity protein-like surface antigen
MKKNLWLMLAALWAWGGLAAPAGAESIWQDGWYTAPKLGVSMFTGQNQWDADNKNVHSDRFTGALALGYNFTDSGAPIRTELEFTMRSPFRTEGEYPDGTKTWQKSSIHTLMFNALLDLENNSALTPYIGAGLAAAFITSKDGTVSGERSASLNKFAWSANGGGAFELTETLALDLGYRYFPFGNLQFDGRDMYKRVRLHEVMLGLRFTNY